MQILQEGDIRDSVAADWSDEFGCSVLDGTKSVKLRGMLGFQGFQYFLFSFKKKRQLFNSSRSISDSN